MKIANKVKIALNDKNNKNFIEMKHTVKNDNFLGLTKLFFKLSKINIHKINNHD